MILYVRFGSYPLCLLLFSDVFLFLSSGIVYVYSQHAFSMILFIALYRSVDFDYKQNSRCKHLLIMHFDNQALLSGIGVGQTTATIMGATFQVLNS